MSEKDLRDLIEEETAATEADREQPVGGGVIERPNRNRSIVFSVRLNPEEAEAVQRLADVSGIPPSTLVRAWIVERIRTEESPNDLRAALASLRRDLDRVERLAS